MALSIPATTQSIFDAFEADQKPTVDYEIADRFSGLHTAEGLTDAERKGAWAEATPFLFVPSEESPWGTHYGPVATFSKPDGTPSYAPDIGVVDEEIISHWEQRSRATQHPVLRARYADVVWDLKKTILGKPADVSYAQIAIDAYLDGVKASLYKELPIHAVQAGRRALELTLSINDKERANRSKQARLGLFDENLKPLHIGARAMIFDCLTGNKRVGLEAAEKGRLIQGLEEMLRTSATAGEYFDPLGRRLGLGD